MRNVQRYVWALLVVAGVTVVAWSARGILTLANFTMIYLLAVLVIAIREGTATAGSTWDSACRLPRALSRRIMGGCGSKIRRAAARPLLLP